MYLLFVQLTPVAVWEECAKFPHLWEHFELHRKTDPSLSFTKFLIIHYQDPAHHQQKHDHSQIPFKDSHHSASGFVFTFIPQQYQTYFESPAVAFKDVTATVFHYSLSFVPNVFLSIWHPPKIS